MKVLMVNGGPHKQGCTATALQQIAKGLDERGVENEIYWLGNEPLTACIACNGCKETQRCKYGDHDGVNEFIEKLQNADGLVLGTPVHFAGIDGKLKCLLDRAFFAASSTFAYKPAACVVSARRAGTTAALDSLQKYPLYAQMPLVASLYWAMVHGATSKEVPLDEEGMDVCYQLGLNMGWILKSIETGRVAGIEPIKVPNVHRTNFIR